LAYTAVKGN